VLGWVGPTIIMTTLDHITQTTTTTTTTTMILSVIISFIVTVGISWILYPAWVVYYADKIDYTVIDLDDAVDHDDDNDDKKSSSRPEVLLSLVIPAYNEEDRISIMLDSAYKYLISSRGRRLLMKLQQQTQTQKQQQQNSDSNSNNNNNNKTKTTTTSVVVEWIIVDDGSKDKTNQVVTETYRKLHQQNQHQQQNQQQSQQHYDDIWKIISLTNNSGKGAAVKTGMNYARGSYKLMVDADGATDFGLGLEAVVDAAMDDDNNENDDDDNDNDNNENDNDNDGHQRSIAVFGSRAHLQQQPQQQDGHGGAAGSAQRSFVRTILMHSFHFFVSLFVSTKIKDTQCGFKLFSASASTHVFSTLHLQRWAFDTEIVILCHQQSIRIIECPVPWHEVDGSKLSTSKFALACVSITMLRDMICVRTCYTFGIWKNDVQKKTSSSPKTRIMIIK
jgi:dolichyl-phosphate beta-glucosyltransferase